MSKLVLNIAKDFARFPGPRLREDGPKSGEEFRHNKLAPALKKALACGEQLTVVLDGARGYTASFLEEAFGGLVREEGFTYEDLLKVLDVRADDERISYWAQKIPAYILEAKMDTAS